MGLNSIWKTDVTHLFEIQTGPDIEHSQYLSSIPLGWQCFKKYSYLQLFNRLHLKALYSKCLKSECLKSKFLCVWFSDTRESEIQTKVYGFHTPSDQKYLKANFLQNQTVFANLKSILFQISDTSYTWGVKVSTACSLFDFLW